MHRKTPTSRVTFTRSLKLALLVLVGVFSLLASNLHTPPKAHAVTSNFLNFQARLEAASGAIAPDGNYNIEFKIYSGTSCAPATGVSCTTEWTETYYDTNGVTAGNDFRLQVANGYITANLGSRTAFPSTINWDQQLFISMNVGGTTQTATPTWDGAMLPYLQLTSVPYAFKAGQLAQANAGGTLFSSLSIQAPTVGNQNFVIQDQGAAGTFNLLTTNAANSGFIQLQSGTPGTQQTGNINVSGTIIGGTINATTALQTGGTTRIDSSGNLSNIADITTTNSYTTNLVRTVPTTVGDEVDLGSLALTFGGGAFQVSVTVPSVNFSVAKNYNFSVQYNQTANTWVTVQPISDSGPYGVQNFALEANVNATTLSLRLRRTSGVVAGTAYIVLKHEGVGANVFTPSTATSTVTAPTAYLSSAILSQSAGGVSVQGGLTVGNGGVLTVQGTGTNTFSGSLSVASGGSFGGALIVGANSAQGDFVQFSDTFDGVTVNTANYNVTGTNTTQNGNLNIIGNSTWTANGITGTQAYRRSNTLTLTTDITTPATATYFMVGFSSSPNVMNYTNMPHALDFSSGSLIVYENGVSRGTVGSYTVSTTYRVRISVNATGARYYLSSDGGDTWTKLYDGTANNVTNSPLYARLNVYGVPGGTIDNLSVSNGQDVLTNSQFIDKNLTIGAGNLAVNSGTVSVGGQTVFSATGILQTAAAAGSYTGITGTGALAAGSIASGFGTIATANIITGTTINGTTGINTGAGAGTQRIDLNGNLGNIGTIQQGNAYPVYKYKTVGQTDTAWKTIANITAPTGSFSGAGFEVDVVNASSNFGGTASQGAFKYYVSVVRSGTVQDDTDAATVSGPVAAEYVQVVKTSNSTYELQVRQPTNYQIVNFTAQVTSQNLATVAYVSSPATGSTGTAYSAAITHTDYAANFNATGNATVGGNLTIQGTGSSTFAGGVGVTGSIDVAGGISTLANGVRTYENAYSSGTNTAATGTFELILPQDTAAGAMMTYTLKGYNYTATTGAWEVIVSGFLASGTWYTTSAQIIGSAPFSSIRLAYDSVAAKPVLLLGGVSTAWAYPQISVTQVTAGYTTINGWGSGYSSTYLAAETNITNIAAPVVQQTASSINAFFQGGNTFGAAAVLGTNDTNSVSIKTNGTTRFTIDATGNTTFTGNVTAGIIQGSTVNATSGYQLNGTAGATTTCTGGQLLQNQVVQGGITTGGTCAAAGGGSGVTTVGALDGGTANATGATITGTTIFLQSASASFAGLVNTAAQTFAGNKTFNGTVLTSTLDTAAAGALSIGATTATSIAVGNTTASFTAESNGTANLFNGATAHTLQIATGAAIQGVTIGSTNSTSSLLLQAGTGNLQIQTQGGTLGIGNNAVAQTLTIGNATGASAVTIQGGTGAINIGTQAVADTITLGNSTGASSVVINSGTGAINVGTNAVAHAITIGNATGATAVTIQAGTGALNLQTQGTGGINIGTNAIAQTVTLGNVTGATSVVVNCGTGACSFGTSAIAHTTTVGTTTGAAVTTIQAGTGGLNLGNNALANTIQIGNTTGAVAQVLSIGNNATASSTSTIILGSTVGTSATTIQGGTGNVNLVTNSASAGTIVKTNTNSIIAFQVQNAAGTPLFLVDTLTTVNLVTNPGFEVNVTGWAGVTGTVTRNVTKGQYYHGQASLTTAVTTAGGGAQVTAFTAAITPATYNFSFYAMNLNAGALGVTITGGSAPSCTLNSTAMVTTGFQRYNCSFTSTTSNVTAITITSTSTGTFYIDGAQLTTGAAAQPYGSQGAIQLRGIINSPATFQSTSNSTTAFQIQNSAGTSNLFVADTLNGRVGIGTATPAYVLDVVGDINTSTGFRVGGTAGANTTCTGGQLLQNQIVLGGITTGGSCVAASTGGITTIGAVDGGTANATAATITGSTLFLQSASASFAGLVNTGTQTFAGAKTFSGGINVGSSGQFQVDTSGNFLTTGTGLIKTTSATAFTIQDASLNAMFNVNTSTGAITFGNATNNIIFTPSGGLVATGTAQHTKSIVLTPEYAGAVLDAASDASCSAANNGTMTSAYDSVNRMNNYNWTSASGTAQCYDVIVQVPIPSDFAGWSGTPDIEMKKDATGTGAYALQIVPSSATDVNYGSYVTPGTLTTSWANMATSSLSGTYTAGNYFTIKIRTTSTSGANVKLGNITLNYNSKY